jgi:hypothetical protein
MITEKIIDNSRIDKGGVYGQIRYEYHSPTHWASDGVCFIKFEHFGSRKPPSMTLHYGVGGVVKDTTPIQLAEAMSQAFTSAAERMKVLEALTAQYLASV